MRKVLSILKPDRIEDSLFKLALDTWRTSVTRVDYCEVGSPEVSRMAILTEFLTVRMNKICAKIILNPQDEFDYRTLTVEFLAGCSNTVNTSYALKPRIILNGGIIMVYSFDVVTLTSASNSSTEPIL